jgi:HD superfamily phosphodiesterase
MAMRCPGQDLRFWKPEDIFEAPCPACGSAVEFWKDEPWRKCRSCGGRVANPRFNLGCAAWCRFAEQCLGRETMAALQKSLGESILRAMKETFGQDQRRIHHALAVLGHAEEVLAEEGGDPLVVRAAAILHDIGIQEAERKHGSAAPKYQELEGPPIARRILERLGVDAGRIEHIVRIVGSHHSAGDLDTDEFRIVWDADRLANWAEECPADGPAAARRYVEKAFRTEAGRRLASARLQREAHAAARPKPER